MAGSLLEQCGLICDEQALVKGKLSISGIANVDAFFSAVLDFTGAVDTVAQAIQVELEGLYSLVGASGPGDFEAALRSKLKGYSVEYYFAPNWTLETATR